MIKNKVMALALLVLSSEVLALNDSTLLNWDEHDDRVKMESCSGTVLAGKWILTAANCQDKQDIHFGSRVDFADTNYQLVDKDSKVSVTKSNGIALWKMKSPVNTSVATLLSISNIHRNDKVKLSGFETRAGVMLLTKFEAKVDFRKKSKKKIFLVNPAHQEDVNPGSAILNEKNKIIGIMSTGGKLKKADASVLQLDKIFILQQVNGWHYPTLVTTSATEGTATIRVQSLHHQKQFTDKATAEGDVKITGGSCHQATVSPFQTCTYEISSNGEEGKIILNGRQIITVNKDFGTYQEIIQQNITEMSKDKFPFQKKIDEGSMTEDSIEELSKDPFPFDMESFQDMITKITKNTTPEMLKDPEVKRDTVTIQIDNIEYGLIKSHVSSIATAVLDKCAIQLSYLGMNKKKIKTWKEDFSGILLKKINFPTMIETAPLNTFINAAVVQTSEYQDIVNNIYEAKNLLLDAYVQVNKEVDNIISQHDINTGTTVAIKDFINQTCKTVKKDFLSSKA